MKLRSKLIITFLILILVPVLFTTVAFFGFGQYQLNSIRKLYGVENVTYETLSNTPAMMSRITRETYDGMQQKAETDPDAFEDTEYLDTVNLDLEKRYSFLVVRKGDSFTYIGNDGDQTDLLESLPEYGAHDADQEQDMGIYIGGNLQALVRQLDFRYSDQTEGTAFIVTSISGMILLILYCIWAGRCRLSSSIKINLGKEMLLQLGFLGLSVHLIVLLMAETISFLSAKAESES